MARQSTSRSPARSTQRTTIWRAACWARVPDRSGERLCINWWERRGVEMLRGRVVAGIVVVVAVALGGCSSDDKPEADSVAAAKASTTTTTARPAGPVADLSEEITGGNGVFLPSGSRAWTCPHRRRRPGTSCTSTSPSGTATSYRVDGEQSSDGRWTFVPDGRRSTRLASSCAGRRTSTTSAATVIVEWLNVSGGVDSAADYDTTYEEIARDGPHLCRRVGADHRRDGWARARGSAGAGWHAPCGAGSAQARPRALRLARPSRRRLCVRHLHPGRACDPRRRRAARRRCSRNG